jgi:hypothetical protein
MPELQPISLGNASQGDGLEDKQNAGERASLVEALAAGDLCGGGGRSKGSIIS